MDNFVQWESGIMSIPANADLALTLNKAGEEGWEPWAILGSDDNGVTVKIALKRHKRKVLLSTDIKGALQS